MIEVVVAFRDAVMATLMAWGGVDGEAVQMDGGAAKPAPVEKVVDHKKSPAAFVVEPECPKQAARHI